MRPSDEGYLLRLRHVGTLHVHERVEVHDVGRGRLAHDALDFPQVLQEADVVLQYEARPAALAVREVEEGALVGVVRRAERPPQHGEARMSSHADAFELLHDALPPVVATVAGHEINPVKSSPHGDTLLSAPFGRLRDGDDVCAPVAVRDEDGAPVLRENEGAHGTARARHFRRYPRFGQCGPVAETRDKKSASLPVSGLLARRAIVRQTTTVNRTSQEQHGAKRRLDCGMDF